jgi:ribosomal protein S18 acetylase RimI-like enzyme
MTGGQKLLIDTNVLIGLEDWRTVVPEFAQLQKLCSQHGHRLFVHEAALADVGRDKDAVRRRITLSKLEKFERISGIRLPRTADLSARYGIISKPNDDVDVALLYALEIGAADFLVTQDQGIHSRAARISQDFADRVLTVADAVGWLVADYEPKSVRLPLVEELPAHAIDAQDEIFESLRDGYPAFDRWWREKCIREHRPCWVVTIEGELAGLVVRKIESHAEAGTKHHGPKILKLCTFKVKPKFRGQNLASYYSSNRFGSRSETALIWCM